MSAREDALREAREVLRRVRHLSPDAARQEARHLVEHLETGERVTLARWVRALADALRTNGPLSPTKGASGARR